MSSRHAWIDASAGIAGDMLLGALVDAGADLDHVQSAVDAVIPDSVRIARQPVTRAGQRATKIDVEVLVDDPPMRTWHTIRTLLAEAALTGPVRDRAQRTFAGLAEAEAAVHGTPVDEVHFHEVGALDSIADVVGVAAALESLRIDTVSASAVAVGSGRVDIAHGDLPVPVPAVTQLARGWRIVAGAPGQLATPTGMALITTLAERCEDLPAMALAAVGCGAGTRDTPGRPNLTRVLIGDRAEADADDHGEPVMIMEANVDDLDPRLWPGVLSSLLAAGAADAWLVPILMKKGRPGYTLSVLARPDQAAELRNVIMDRTSTLGVRTTPAAKWALPRHWIDVAVTGGTVPIKIASQNGVIVRATPEFGGVARVAAASGMAEQQVLAEAQAAAAAAGLVPGAPVTSRS